MTSNRNKSSVTQLLLASFPLFVLLQALAIIMTTLPPTALVVARNIKSSTVAAATGNRSSNQTDVLVIMANGSNVTSIYNSFADFKTMFGVEFSDDRRIAFKNGEGKLPIPI